MRQRARGAPAEEKARWDTAVAFYSGQPDRGKFALRNDVISKALKVPAVVVREKIVRVRCRLLAGDRYQRLRQFGAAAMFTSGPGLVRVAAGPMTGPRLGRCGASSSREPLPKTPDGKNYPT